MVSKMNMKGCWKIIHTTKFSFPRLQSLASVTPNRFQKSGRSTKVSQPAKFRTVYFLRWFFVHAKANNVCFTKVCIWERLCCIIPKSHQHFWMSEWRRGLLVWDSETPRPEVETRKGFLSREQNCHNEAPRLLCRRSLLEGFSIYFQGHSPWASSAADHWQQRQFGLTRWVFSISDWSSKKE